MSTETLPAVISERHEPDGTRVWLLGENLVMSAKPETVAGIHLVNWKVTLIGVNGISATVDCAPDDLALTVNCWCTLVAAAAKGGLDEC